MPTVVIVRHGQSRANVAGKAGSSGTWLTQQGRGDASRAARNILRDQQGDLSTSVARQILREHGHRKFAVISSSFRRAKQTAAPLARALGVKIQIQPGVHERNLGVLRHQDVSTWQNEPGYFTRPGEMQLNPDYKPKHGESLRDVQKRAVAGLHDAIQRNPGKDLVLFTHGHTARALEARIRGSWKGLTNWKNGEHRTFEYEPKMIENTVESTLRGNLELYHRTTPEAAAEIVRTGSFRKPVLSGHSAHYRDHVWASTHKSGQADGYGSAVVAFDVKPEHAELDDEFPNGEKHYTVHHRHARNPRLVENAALIEASAHTPVAFHGLLNDFNASLAADMIHSYGSADSAMYALRGLSLKHQQTLPGKIHSLLRDAESQATNRRTPAALPALKYAFGDKVSSKDGQITGRVVGLARYSKPDKDFMYNVSQDKEPAIVSVHPESMLKPILMGKKRRDYNESISSLVDRLLEGRPGRG